MDDRDLRLDGNAAAGLLGELLTVEATTAAADLRGLRRDRRRRRRARVRPRARDGAALPRLLRRCCCAARASAAAWSSTCAA